MDPDEALKRLIEHIEAEDAWGAEDYYEALHNWVFVDEGFLPEGWGREQLKILILAVRLWLREEGVL